MADAFPTRSAIASEQLVQLRALLDALVPANPFYTAKFQAAGFTHSIRSLADFFQHAPFTRKQELVADQLAHPPYGSDLTYPLENYTRSHQTSGTAGSPLRWLDTPANWEWMVNNWIEVYRAAEVRPADRLYFAFSFGPFIGFWLAYEAGARLGALCLPGGGMSSAARLRAILAQGATVLCCTPTYAIHLAEVAAQEKIDLGQSQVRKIIVAGEPGGSIPATRKHIEQLWHGARVFDHHGMTEVGPVTFECPAQPGLLHVIEPGYLAEVINPATGQPVSAGETGELVLTTLGRVGSPLLRYHTGDLVKPVFAPAETQIKPCACGRSTLALEGGILGRTDDMVVVRGVNVYPTAVEEVIRSCEDVAEYCVYLSHSHTLTEMRIEIEPNANCADVPGLIRELQKIFDSAMALRVPVTSVAPGSLPRFELKAKRWVKA